MIRREFEMMPSEFDKEDLIDELYNADAKAKSFVSFVFGLTLGMILISIISAATWPNQSNLPTCTKTSTGICYAAAH